jgi:heterotetrameric sarcosine oxidase gamma subunit
MGYIVVGRETDGTVTPDDVGLGWTIAGADFVGGRSLSLPNLKPADLKRADRRQLVGLLPADPTLVLEEGAALVPTPIDPAQSDPAQSDPAQIDPTQTDPTQDGAAADGHDRPNQAGRDQTGRDQTGRDQTGRNHAIGHVTSSYRSPTLGRSFALALVAGGRSLIGSRLIVPMGNTAIEVMVTDKVLLDKAGERLQLAPRPRPAIEKLVPAADQPALVARECESVRLTALAPTTRLSVRAGSAASTAIGLALGVLLPTVPCRSVVARDRAALWLGPDEWLIVAPQTASDLAALATKAASGHAASVVAANVVPTSVVPASVVDVSHRSRTLEISGPRAAWCLNAFCALDLEIDAFPPGMCTRTMLGKAEIVLWRIAPAIFQLDVVRSFVPYVWACLEAARLEFADAKLIESQISVESVKKVLS